MKHWYLTITRLVRQLAASHAFAAGGYGKLWLAMVIFIGAHTASAQSRMVTGKISDENGAALPGVSIVVRGTGYNRGHVLRR